MTSTRQIPNLSPMSFWAQPMERKREAFRWLRENAPVSWQEPPEALDPAFPNTKGYWAVVKHKHIKEVSATPKVFSSAEGAFMDDFPQPETMISFIATDAPRHTEMRGIVSKAFTPKHLALMQDDIRRVVREVVDEAVHLGEGDLGELITKQVPGRVFSGFFGIKDRDQVQYMIDVAEQMGAWADPEFAHIGTPLMVFADAAFKLGGLALELAKERRANPTEDLMSWVSQAQYEGQKMTVEEVGVFFTLLAGAANDTTRHSMGRILELFQKHPDQLAYLFEDFENRAEDAVNECLRYEPPLMHFRRTATEDYELGGQLIRAGEKVVIWYVSGNRDEEVFPDADRFDVTRPSKQNPHQAFGGGGPHHCLGNMLGRQVLRNEIWEIYTRMNNLEVRPDGPILSNFMNGVMRLPATWTPASR